MYIKKHIDLVSNHMIWWVNFVAYAIVIDQALMIPTLRPWKMSVIAIYWTYSWMSPNCSLSTCISLIFSALMITFVSGHLSKRCEMALWTLITLLMKASIGKGLKCRPSVMAVSFYPTNLLISCVMESSFYEKEWETHTKGCPRFSHRIWMFLSFFIATWVLNYPFLWWSKTFRELTKEKGAEL